MQHDKKNKSRVRRRYLAALKYAQKILGDSAALYSNRLEVLAHGYTLPKLQATIRWWRHWEEHPEISGRLKGGARKRTRGHVPLEDPVLDVAGKPILDAAGKPKYLANIVDDAVQAGWDKVLEAGPSGDISPRKLSSIGQTTGKTLAREERRYAPAVTEYDDGEETVTPLAPWDKEIARAYPSVPCVPPLDISIEDEVRLLFKSKAPHPCGGRISDYESYVAELKLEEPRKLLARLKRENPGQHRLLLTYFKGVRRGRPFSKTVSNRVAAIVEKLRRWAGLTRVRG